GSLVPSPHRGSAVAVPLLADVLVLRPRGPGGPRRDAWQLAHAPSDPALPSVGWLRRRPAAAGAGGYPVIALVTWAYGVAAGSVLDPLYTALGWVMAWLYAVVPSYGVAIVLLTVAVRLVLYPLTVKQ